MLESLCPSYSLRCLIYPKIGEDRWCWKYIFTKCRRHFDPRNFLGSMVLKINFIERRWLVDKCMRGDFWRCGDMKRNVIVYTKKINGKCGVNWNGFFIYLYIFRKKFELESRHSRLLIVKIVQWLKVVLQIFIFPPCLSYIFHSIIKLVVSVHIITCIRKKLINLYINHMKLSIKLIKLCNIKYDIFGPDKLINM